MPVIPYPISEVYCWVVDDPTGTHALLGYLQPGKHIQMQCAGASRSLVERMESEAARLSKELGLPIRLQRFVLAETIKTVAPF
jgi:hypothetical protein